MKLALLFFVSFGAAAQALPGAEKVEFPTGKETIFGYLMRPEQPAARTPAMVIVHGSGGVTVAREGFWARELAALGITALAIDSFTPRGVDVTMDDQTRVTQGQMVRDAYAALGYLASQPAVDAQRIGVIGFSKGGGVALMSADVRTRPDSGAFAAHIPLYPACVTQYRNPRMTAPLLMLIGADDNYTGVKTCSEYVERMRAAGGRAELKLYPGAHHGFDGNTMNERPFFVARAENYKSCLITLEDDGRSVYARTGETIRSPQQAFELMRRDCVTRGATVAANARAKMQALEDVKAFLKTTLLQ